MPDESPHCIEISSPCILPTLSDFPTKQVGRCSGGGSASDKESGGKDRQLANFGKTTTYIQYDNSRSEEIRSFKPKVVCNFETINFYQPMFITTFLHVSRLKITNPFFYSACISIILAMCSRFIDYLQIKIRYTVRTYTRCSPLSRFLSSLPIERVRM